MLKDITFGQFFPGDSTLHRMDARVKILLTIAYIVLIFCVDSAISYGLFVAFTFILMFLSQIPVRTYVKSVKPMFVFIFITAILNLFLSDGTVVWSWRFISITDKGIILAIQMMIRVTLLVISSSVLTYTTSPIRLTSAIESIMKPLSKIGVPSHEIAMMMTIALRFIPTLIDEADKITKAQTARGADFEGGNIISRAKAMIPLLVPLFISAFRRADDLAIAMESRCYHGGEGRTSLHVPKIGLIDVVAIFVVAILLFIPIAEKYLPMFS
ncbi:MAG: energy-coupling factor transporter transmembrane component T [Eubacteriales bacterium]|nr:energy-coupling factor transporter transmembrane component T [Eubacteriales bacterium]